jgi:hypothetical protein
MITAAASEATAMRIAWRPLSAGKRSSETSSARKSAQISAPIPRARAPLDQGLRIEAACVDGSAVMGLVSISSRRFPLSIKTNIFASHIKRPRRSGSSAREIAEFH